MKSRRALQLFLGLIALNLGFILFWAQIQENVVVSFSQLWAYPWFKVLLFNFYVAIFLFSLWVFTRERAFKACLWTFSFMLLGLFAVLAYIILSLNQLKNKKDLTKK